MTKFVIQYFFYISICLFRLYRFYWFWHANKKTCLKLNLNQKRDNYSKHFKDPLNSVHTMLLEFLKYLLSQKIFLRCKSKKKI